MRELNFATAKNGRTKEWRHRTLSISRIFNYLQRDRKIKLSTKEFHALSTDEKAKIKNGNAAFIGGFFEGRRTSVNMRTRSIIALDIDKKFPGDLYEFLKEKDLYPFYIYESISSTPKHQKYRVLFFLSEDIDANYYEPVARRIAKNLGIIDFVDHTCYRKTQLMYAPVFCRDAKGLNEFYGRLDAPFLNVNEILSTFKNIGNPTEWDSARDEKALKVQNSMTLVDPRTKAGLIGAFCEYVGDLHKAITLYNLPYEQTGEDRYSYTGGSSSNGFVIYDDGQWGYSNHESDPAATGHDLNAFDLVRIHLFSDRDREDGYKDQTRAPSFKALNELLTNDNNFMEFYAQRKTSEILDSIQDDFADVFESSENEDESDDVTTKTTKRSKRRIKINGKTYKKDPTKDKDLGAKLRNFEKSLIRSSENGSPVNNKTNVYRAISKHPLLEDRILFDTFTRRASFVGRRPWPRTEKGDFWNENDDFMLSVFLEKHDLKVATDVVSKATAQVSQEQKHQFNSLANFFTYQLPEWDGTERIATLFHDAFNAEKNDINATIAKKTLLGGLERALSDEATEVKAIPVLQGPQSVGKSSFWRLLAIERDWFNDSKIEIGSKDGLSILAGSFIVEFAEFASIKKADRDEVKSYLSSSVDKYRPAYARSEKTFVRHNIFVGSVNDEEFLTDTTGNVRYKVVKTPGDATGAARMFNLMTKEYILQLWAEAMTLRANGESHLYTADEDKETERIAAVHTKTGSFDELIEAFVVAKKPKDWAMIVEDYERTAILNGILSGAYDPDELTIEPAKWFSIRDLNRALGIKENEEARYRQQIAAALKNIDGVEPKKRKINGVQVRGYDYLG